MLKRSAMNMFIVLVLGAVPNSVLLGAKGGKGGPKDDPGGCSNPQLTVTLLPLLDGAEAAISGDGSDSYEATLNLCSGSTDVTANYNKGQRTMGFAFSAPEADLGVTPDWAPATFQGHFFFNIRNVLCSAGVCGDTFTAHMTWGIDAPDGARYNLRFYPNTGVDSPDTTSPWMLSRNPDLNSPLQTSPVAVTHTPGSCHDGGNGYDVWIVDASVSNPDGITQVGTLYQRAKNSRQSDVHMGQFSFPFRLRLEAQSCF